jgi:excisionase family DNA binding protein
MLSNIILSPITLEELRGLISSSVSQSVEAGLSQLRQSGKEQEAKGFLKLTDVSKLLKVSKVTIHAWKKAGLLPFYRIGRRVYFKESEVLEAMKKIDRKGQHR